MKETGNSTNAATTSKLAHRIKQELAVSRSVEKNGSGIHKTVEPLYSAHQWGMKFWPLQRGGGVFPIIIILCGDAVGTKVSGHYIERVATHQGCRPLEGKGQLLSSYTT